MRSRSLLLTLVLAAQAAPGAAQERLPLADAIARAVASHPSIRASNAAVGEAAARVTQARAAYLPRVDIVESAQRGNQPVFAFSSLLGARQFSASDFAIESLNHPAAVTNYHTAVSFEQLVFDGLRTRSASRSAELGRQVAEAQGTEARGDIALAATQAYGKVVFAAASRNAANSAVRAAEEDVRRAEHRRDTGIASEADVLALRVHLAQMRERAITAGSDETIARAELNQAIGAPLDAQWMLDEVAPAPASVPGLPALELEAVGARPELREARLQEQLARETRAMARSSFLPQVSVQGYVELNGNSGAFSNRASAWLVGAQARWTIFQGLADVGRLREAGLATVRAGAERERAETAVRLDVRTAAARIESAVAREQVGRSATAQALESQRIIRDRYEAGLASVGDVLRAANAVLDAESQRIGASVDLLVSQALLDRALGRVPGQK